MDTPTPASKSKNDRLTLLIPRPSSAPAHCISVNSPGRPKHNTIPEPDDDIPCRFEIDDKLITGKLRRSFETTIQTLVERGKLERALANCVCTSIIIGGPTRATADSNTGSTAESRASDGASESEAATEVMIDADSWHVLRHYARKKFRSSGDLMIVQVSHLDDVTFHSGTARDSTSRWLSRVNNEAGSTASSSPKLVYLNASPRMITINPESIAYDDDHNNDDEELTLDHGPDEHVDAETESITNDIFICIGCTHHFDMSCSVNIDELEHISSQSRREGVEAGWFCYGCLSEAYGALRERMEEMRTAMQENRVQVDVEEVDESENTVVDLAQEDEELEISHSDIDPDYKDEKDTTRSPGGSDITLTGTPEEMSPYMDWISLQDTFSVELARLARWTGETGLESPNKEAKQVEDQMMTFRLELMIIMSSDDMFSNRLVKTLGRLALHLEQHAELLVERPRLWLDILSVCPAPRLGMAMLVIDATSRLNDMVESLLTAIDFHHEVELARATRVRLEDTFTQLSRSKLSLNRLRTASTQSIVLTVRRIYHRKLRLAMSAIIDTVRWIWEDDGTSKRELKAVRPAMAKIVQTAMDIVWIIEETDYLKTNHKEDGQRLRNTTGHLWDRLLESIDSQIAERPTTAVSMRARYSSPALLTPTRTVSRFKQTLVSSPRSTQPGHFTEKMQDIEREAHRLVRPVCSVYPSPVTASSHFGRSRTPADEIPSTLLWKKTPVECISPRTMERALRRSRALVRETSVLRESTRVKRMSEA